MATPRSCTNLKQVLPSSSITGSGDTAIFSSLASLCHSVVRTALQGFQGYSIVCAVLVSIAVKTWGCQFSFFSASSIHTICSSVSMAALFPDGVFFVEWPTWARLAIVSSSEPPSLSADESQILGGLLVRPSGNMSKNMPDPPRH